MRNFDNWLEYLVDGKPFFGRFTFYKLHTTEKITITSESGVALSNPILSDAYGRTSSQVFLPDEDVTVLMESFIGSGEMSDNEENISAWKEERTFDSLKNSVIIDVDGESVVASMAGNVTELRSMDPTSCNYAILCGYNQLGDMPPAFYKLEYNQIANDNGGSVHRINTEYIWRLIKPMILDIRVFGVFPANSYSSVSPEASNIANAFDYANTNGISVYMPEVYSTGGYYGFEGGNYTLQQTLYLDYKTHIVGKTGTSSSLYLNKVEGGTAGFMYWHNSHNLGNLTVSVESVRSSWLNNWNQSNYMLVPRKELIIDSNVVINNARTYSDLEKVYIAYHNWNPGAAVGFDNIQEFQCPGNLSMEGHFNFYNMREIRDSWWNLEDTTHGGPYIKPELVSLTDCNYQLEDFLYVRNYVDLAYTNDNQREFNLEGRLFEASILTAYNDTTWSNGEIKNLCLTGNVTFRDIKGSVSTSGAASWNNFQAEDCYMTGSLPFMIAGNVYVKSCTFTSTAGVGSTLPFFHGSSCVLRDSIFNGYSTIQVPYNAVITGCTFAPNALGADSNVYAFANAANGHMSITFSNNVLTRAKLTLTAQTAQYPILNQGSVYVGNSITDSKDGTNWLKWNFAVATSGHTYSYKNNDGPDVLQQTDYTVVLTNVPNWFNNGGNPPASRLYIEYTGPHEVASIDIPDVIVGYNTISIPGGGNISVPVYGKSEDVHSWCFKSRLVGLTVADLNLFCFTANDFSGKRISIAVQTSKKDGEDPKKYLNTGLSNNSIGIPANLNLPEFTTNSTAQSSSAVPVPYAYQDLVLTTTLTDVRVIS